MTDNGIDPSQGIDYRKELYASFALDEHEIREGGKNKAGTKVQWFVYVRREAIQHRLDDLFFMEWELTYDKPTVGTGFVSVAATISIRGMRKEYNGGARPKGKEMSEDTAKAAYTDAFKRAASMWGIGLYLQNTPQIWTASYPDGDWDAKRAREDEAWKQFAAWFKGEDAPKPTLPSPKVTTLPPQESTGTRLGGGTQPPTTGDSKVMTCERITVLQKKDGFQYIAHCGHNINVVTYNREKYREALGVLVEGWNVEVTAKGKVIPMMPPLRLEVRANGSAWELVKVLG